MRMSRFSFITKALALLVLVGASGCTSPMTTAMLPVPAVGANQARIVLQLPPSRGLYHQLGDVGFVTVRLQSEDHQSTLFAEATKTGGSFVVDFTGLVAGPWNMRTLLYDNAASMNLLFYAQQTETIEVGSVTTTTIAAYEVGTIGGLSPTSALLPDSIEVTDLDGTTTAGTPRSLNVGNSLALHPLVNSSVAGTPASDGRVTWETSDQTVATVSSSGRVDGEGPGNAVIVARSVADRTVVGQFWVEVSSALVGLWQTIEVANGATAPDSQPAVKGSQSSRATSVTQRGLLRLTADGTLTTYALGPVAFFAGKGVYTASGDWFAGSTTHELDLSTGLWVALPKPDSGGNRFSVNRDSLQVFSSYGTSTLYTRINEVPLTAVGVNYPATMFAGERFTPTVSLTPSDPTFPQVVWMSSDSAVARVAAYTGEVRALASGTVTVTGQSLGSGLPLASATITVAIPSLQAVSAGDRHTLLLTTDGRLLATGWGNRGQLGIGSFSSTLTPVQIMSGVASVSAGYEHTMILKADGTLWATGRNNYGQLGTGDTTNQATPVQVMTGVKAVSAGMEHTMILKTNGELWAVGRNDSGQLGDGSLIDQWTPVYVTNDVLAVSSGSTHTLLLKTNHDLYATGDNNYFELGDNSIPSQSIPVFIRTGVRAIVASDARSFIVTDDQTLSAVGYNNSGQLGDGTTINRTTFVPVLTGVDVAEISANFFHTMVLLTNGDLLTWGDNSWGQLGDGAYAARTTPSVILSNVVSMAAGSFYSMVVLADGSLRAMGTNSVGNFGNGTSSYSAQPTPSPIAWWVQPSSPGNNK